MGSPAAGAKIVTTMLLGAAGAGVFAGVSHDGRGAEPIGTDNVVDVVPSTAAATAPVTSLLTSTTVVAPTSSTSTSTVTTASASTETAPPATPDPAPRRARVRSGAS
jgi:hypothetical protein